MAFNYERILKGNVEVVPLPTVKLVTTEDKEKLETKLLEAKEKIKKDNPYYVGWAG